MDTTLDAGPDADLGRGLRGRPVIVTGAAGTIGRATASLLATCGARVIAVDLDPEAVRAIVAALPGAGHRACVADLTQAAGPAILSKLDGEPPRALIHLAAVLERQPLASVTEDAWDRQMAVNLKATFFLCRDIATAMAGDGATGGSVVLVGSQGWWTGGVGDSAVYAAGKGGVVTLMRSLARHFGPAAVRFNVLSPGAMNTSMRGETADQARTRIRAGTSLGRLGDPGEIAGPAVFLASDWASWITGAVLNASGGFLPY